MTKLISPEGKIRKVHIVSDNYYPSYYMAYVRTGIVGRKRWRASTKKDAKHGLVECLKKSGWSIVGDNA